MAENLTRKQAIKRGRRLHNAERVYAGFQSFLRIFKKNAPRKEVWIDTAFGKAKTLCYGFENPATAPVFFDLHGGGFILGGAAMDEAINVTISQQVGCKVISIEYAKAPDHPYPVAVNQVYAVVEHIFENAAEYGIDPAKMAIGGHSAGGNLSTVACMKAKKAGKFQFACQVLDYPPLDLATDPFDKPHPKGAIPPQMALVFNTCYFDPSEAKDPYISPVYASQEDLEGLPPALLILAGRDSLHDEGLRYRQQLAKAGVETECVQYPNAAHGFTLYPSADTSDAVAKMAAFLKKYLF
ncbi:MAG: alpha/beta hydrolase [Anaerolineales bacterium]